MTRKRNSSNHSAHRPHPAHPHHSPRILLPSYREGTRRKHQPFFLTFSPPMKISKSKLSQTSKKITQHPITNCSKQISPRSRSVLCSDACAIRGGSTLAPLETFVVKPAPSDHHRRFCRILVWLSSIKLVICLSAFIFAASLSSNSPVQFKCSLSSSYSNGKSRSRKQESKKILEGGKSKHSEQR